MKKYNTPNAEFAKFDTEEIMSLSVVDPNAPAEKIVINGLSLDATSLGSQDFSIFKNND
ncbi:MAG: hypothetical protein IKU47_00155 [Oscillospiraceae bacterium]|nr:hypothetical protein [Oscillospiraceae bacterium]